MATSRTTALLEDLQRTVHGLATPFACGGTLFPERPVTLWFRDKTRLPVLRAPDVLSRRQLLEPLVQRCSPAPFGKMRKTLYDSRVRDALQLQAEGGAFSVNFDPGTAGILEQIHRELVPGDPAPPTADLHGLNLYGSGGHFVRHKDTPRGSDMLGSLVVCLPSRFSNGALAVSHRGVFRTFDWATAIREQAEPDRLHWASFFGDVDHQIEKVWSGLRVTVTWLLRRADGKARLPAIARGKLPSVLREKIRALLDDRRFLPRGGTLAFPCAHLYHQDTHFQRRQKPFTRGSSSLLKGRDSLVATAVMAEGLKVTLCPYLIENCVDETWQLQRFPTAREQLFLDERMDPTELERALEIRASSEQKEAFGLTWVEPRPHFNGMPTMYPDAGRSEPLDRDLPAVAHLHACEFSTTGYFGNEGSDVDFYVYGALHVEIPRYGEGARLPGKEIPSRVRSSPPKRTASRR